MRVIYKRGGTKDLNRKVHSDSYFIMFVACAFLKCSSSYYIIVYTLSVLFVTAIYTLSDFEADPSDSVDAQMEVHHGKSVVRHLRSSIATLTAEQNSVVLTLTLTRPCAASSCSTSDNGASAVYNRARY